ncbi:MAG: HpcH/HpaI aldolase/citrate lyase family protein [Gammaproteobacteria bacterium]
MRCTDDNSLPWALGAPLYMPANRRDIVAVANGDKLPALRTVVLCTEDAVSALELGDTLEHLRRCLQGLKPAADKRRFIRARNPETLARLLDMAHIESVDGFVLPKFNAHNMASYLELLRFSRFTVMPTLETRDAFDPVAMRELRAALLQQDGPAVLALRIGGNDLMNLLGIRRPRGLTVYDTPLGSVIAQLVTIFKPFGFALSAPVFEYLDDAETLQREIRLDLAHGLIGKTAIHPGQIACIEACYRVDAADLEMADCLLEADRPAVFKMHEAMCEVSTHRRWAEEIRIRKALFGCRERHCLPEVLQLATGQ